MKWRMPEWMEKYANGLYLPEKEKCEQYMNEHGLAGERDESLVVDIAIAKHRIEKLTKLYEEQIIL